MNTKKFKLNFYQIIGILIYSIGSMVLGVLNNSIGLIIAFFGILGFIISSNFRWGFLLSFIVFVIGYLFKIQHWPYGNLIILLGLLIAAISGFVKLKDRNFKIDLILIYISLIILGSGYFLKFARIQFSMELIFIGFCLISLSYSIRFLKKDQKNFEDYNKIAIVLLWSIATVFKTFHWPKGNVFGWISLFTLWTWLFFSFIRELKSKDL